MREKKNCSIHKIFISKRYKNRKNKERKLLIFSDISRTKTKKTI